MKCLLFVFCLLFALFSSPVTVAGSRLMFNVSATGVPDNVSITLCLNGQAALSCQTYSASALTLLISTTIPNHVYPAAGIIINTPGYSVFGCTKASNGYCLFSVSNTSPVTFLVSNNPPWYPSLEAFEHYNSGRSHVFPEAQFGGSYFGNNTVTQVDSSAVYPSGYNMAYLDANQAFIYGGGYANNNDMPPVSIGAYVAKIDPDTLNAVWYTQLIDVCTDGCANGEWDYPGSMGILRDGYIYVSYGYRLAKLDPATGNVLATLVLPTGGGQPSNTSFNGFNATSDGTIVMKSVYREAGCTIQGPDALLNCPDPTDVPPSILVSVNPQTMQVIDTITLAAPVGARPTIGQYGGQDYVYLLEPTTALRYGIYAGKFILDNSWSPGTITLPGQTLCTSFVVMNDWVVAQTNTLQATTALSVIAINQSDASKMFRIQPFLGATLPPIAALFAPNISWAPMSVSADPDNNLIYASDSIVSQIAAITITPNGLQTVWSAPQRTTEFTALIGPPESRVLVGTDIPGIPGANYFDWAVWRNAATGQEIARSTLLPAMTQGTMIQPYYFGDMFYEGQAGTLIKLQPASNG